MQSITLSVDEFDKILAATPDYPSPRASRAVNDYIHETLRNAEDRSQAGLDFTTAGDILEDARTRVIRHPDSSVERVTRYATEQNLGEGSPVDEQIRDIIGSVLKHEHPTVLLSILADYFRYIGHVIFVAEDE